MKVSREPAVWVGLIGSALTVGASLGLPWLDAGAAAAITVFVSAGALAVFTRPVTPALFVGAFGALAAVVAEYGLHWSDAQVGAVGAFILGAFAFFGVRPQVDPTDFRGKVIEGQTVLTPSGSESVPR
jgi:hypothetical protein